MNAMSLFGQHAHLASRMPAYAGHRVNPAGQTADFSLSGSDYDPSLGLDFLDEYALGTKTETGAPTGSAAANSGRTTTAILSTVGTLIGETGDVIAAIITSGSATDRARIEANTRLQLMQLQQQMQQSTSSAETALLQQHIRDVTAMNTELRARMLRDNQPIVPVQPGGMSRNTMIALGVGAAVLLVGGMYLATRPRATGRSRQTERR